MPNNKRVNLVAIQALIDAKDYCSSEVFERRVLTLCDLALATVDRQSPTFISFPELFALPLLFELGAKEPSPVGTTGAFIKRQLGGKWKQTLGSMLKTRSFGVKNLLLPNALKAHQIYQQTFSKAAREYGVYLLAGSIFLPPIEHEVSQGTYLTSNRVYHGCSMYNPEGKEIGYSRKTRLTPGLETSLLTPAPMESLTTIPTSFGRVGVLICFDAFFDSLLRWMDNQEVQILVQPSANDGWAKPWKFNQRLGTDYSEADVWMQFGVIPGIQGRERIRYCVNPMLVGPYAGIQFAGRSSIGANEKLTQKPPLLVQAKSDSEEEIITATVDL